MLSWPSPESEEEASEPSEPSLSWRSSPESEEEAWSPSIGGPPSGSDSDVGGVGPTPGGGVPILNEGDGLATAWQRLGNGLATASSSNWCY